MKIFFVSHTILKVRYNIITKIKNMFSNNRPTIFYYNFEHPDQILLPLKFVLRIKTKKTTKLLCHYHKLQCELKTNNYN